MSDPVNHPSHYNSHPAKCACGAGIECIDIVEHMSFNVGSAMKYLFRAGLKSPDPDEDLAKAAWYIERERQRLKGLEKQGDLMTAESS
jgi:hypothetical protein